ncbi:MAG: glycosyltransferase family 4 protein [Candidatus Omnitrophica bacterium]|nr:glycosyltransferase family 4 protein [Candidatus Omnitrophota bacterium]
MKVAFLMGNRLSAWHTRMYEPLLGLGVDLKALTYRPLRFPLDQVRIPYEIIPNRAETRTLGKRIREGIENRLVGTPVNEDPADLVARLEGFDLIHSWELFSADTEAALEAKKRWGTPVLVTVWDNLPFHREEDPVFAKRKQRARKEVDRFLVYTHDSRKTLIEEGVESTRIQLIPPSVDLEAFSPATSPPKNPVILGVGRMVPEKGFEDLIEAVGFLLKDRTRESLTLRLLGAGPNEEAVDRLAETRGLGEQYERVPVLDYSELPEFLRQGTVLVLGSKPTPEWKEQFGMILIEAMACGVVVIGAKSGAIPEIIGGAGLVYEPGAFDELAECLRQVLDRDAFRESLTAKGLEQCRNRFDRVSNAKQVLSLYESLVR